MEEIVKKRETPELPDGIRIKYGNWEFHTGEDTEIKDLSEKVQQVLWKKCGMVSVQACT